MARKNPLCLLLGHRWKRLRRTDGTVLLTCKRCGHVDVVDTDLGGSFHASGAGF